MGAWPETVFRMTSKVPAWAAIAAASAGVDVGALAVEIAVIEAADGSVQLVAYITVADDASAAAAQGALAASFRDEASAAVVLAATGVTFGAGMFETLVLIGREATIRRLRRAADELG